MNHTTQVPDIYEPVIASHCSSRPAVDAPTFHCYEAQRYTPAGGLFRNNDDIFDRKHEFARLKYTKMKKDRTYKIYKCVYSSHHVIVLGKLAIIVGVCCFMCHLRTPRSPNLFIGFTLSKSDKEIFSYFLALLLVSFGHVYGMDFKLKIFDIPPVFLFCYKLFDKLNVNS